MVEDAHLQESGAGHFRMLASAVAGKPVPVVLRGSAPVHTDGQRIFAAAGGSISDTAIAAQALLLSGDSLDSRFVRPLVGRKHAAGWYLAIEVVRLSSTFYWTLPPGLRQRLMSVTVPNSTSAAESVELARSRRKEQPPVTVDFGELRPPLILRTPKLQQEAWPLSTPTDDEDAERYATTKARRSLLRRPGLSSPLARMLGHKAGDGDGSPGEGGGLGGLTVGRANPVTRGKKLRGAGSRLPVINTPSTGGYLYPEWDGVRRRYRANWCTVREYSPDAAEQSPGRVIDPSLRGQIARIGLRYQRHRRQHDGDDLDLTAVVDYAMARATGSTADDRIYVQDLRTGRDLGVVIVLDCSGSTTDSSGRGLTHWAEAQLAADGLIASFEDVGARVAAYAFRSRGRNDLQFLRVKHFDGRYTSRAAAALMAITPSGYTRLGGCIRHASRMAAVEAGTRDRLVILVSDAHPFDADYEGNYAELDVVAACAEARRNGVGVVSIVGLGGESTRERALRMFGRDRLVPLGTRGALRRNILPASTSALAHARAQTKPKENNGVGLH